VWIRWSTDGTQIWTLTETETVCATGQCRGIDLASYAGLASAGVYAWYFDPAPVTRALDQARSDKSWTSYWRARNRLLDSPFVMRLLRGWSG
jgi:hypothetical protein